MTTCEVCKIPKREGIVDVKLGKYTGKRVCARCFFLSYDYMEGEILTEEEVKK